MKKLLITLTCCVAGMTATAQTFKDDKSLSFHERAKMLVSQLTVEEKVKQIGNNVGAITRLGIKKYNYWNEGIHGVARSGEATSFPVSKGLSSMWDAPLMFRIATAISDEARIYNIQKGKDLTYWCPTINMSRDPRWGRDEENYGEDPYLAGILAVEYIKGMQGDDPKYLKTVATAKHFVANNYEKERHSHSSNMDDRNLREYYLPAFEMSVKDGKVASIMSAYNALNGVPCCANPELLTYILRDEWKFDGFVTSDCGAIKDIWDEHLYVQTPEEACAVAIKAGEDMNCGGQFQGFTLNAIKQGLISEAEVDTALVRVFEARFRLGEFDDDVVWNNIDQSLLNCQAHQDLALQAAHESIVMLKNEAAKGQTNPFLPLDPTKKVAIIGPLGNLLVLGGYSGTPVVSSNIREAMAARLGIELIDYNSQFEDYSQLNGNIGAEANGCDGNLGNIKAGAWAAYNDVDFGEGVDRLIINSASANGADKATIVNIYLDNMSGTPATTLTLPATGGWSWYMEKTYNVDPAVFCGKHKLYFEFQGGNTYCSNMDWYRFYDSNDMPADLYDPYMQFENFAEINGAGMKAEANGCKGNLGNIKAGYWAAYNDVNLGKGMSHLAIRSASANNSAKPTVVNIYLDEMTGEPAATITLSVTGKWNEYTEDKFDVDPAVFNGQHKLYFEFQGGNIYCSNMDWFCFYDTDEMPTEKEEEDSQLYYTRGCNVTGTSGTDLEGAKEIAKKADVVIFAAGTDLSVMNEGLDRSAITLPGDQQKLLEAVYSVNPNIVLVLQSGSSLDITWAKNNVPAIIEAWYAGQAQGEAITDVLYGDYNPSGKLTSTWYASVSDLGDIKDYDIRKGKRTYMYYDKTPLYPFGYGLSYTTFEYSNLKLSTKTLGKDETLTITFDVKNTGEKDGAEVVQLYTHAKSEIERPIKELKGFDRIELAAGETKTVTLTLAHDQLRYYNDATATFDVEDGEVDVMIGASSADIRLKDKINAKGATVLETYKSGTNGIDNISAGNRCDTQHVYDIKGNKVSEGKMDKLSKGVYITNGKKIVKE